MLFVFLQLRCQTQHIQSITLKKIPTLRSKDIFCFNNINFFAALKYADIKMDLHKTDPKLPDDSSKLLFGQKFTDHMMTIEWTAQAGWASPKIGPFKNLEIHPAAKVLHYSIEIFEGMKAYNGVDGKIRLFRPDLNATRLAKSAHRSALPVI